MERDYGREIDQLRQELQEIRQQLLDQSGNTEQIMKATRQMMDMLQQKSLEPAAPEQLPERKTGHIQKMPCMHPDMHVRAVLDQLENDANEHNSAGRLSYIGTYESGGNQSTWIRHSVDVDPLLQQIENGSAARVLSCVGSNDRLRLLLAMLKKPMTVSQMVTECGFNTTGQVYNHLRSLIAVDLVVEDSNRSRGTYSIRPHRVQGLIMLLAGINDLLDNEYTQADYGEEE